MGGQRISERAQRVGPDLLDWYLSPRSPLSKAATGDVLRNVVVTSMSEAKKPQGRRIAALTETATAYELGDVEVQTSAETQPGTHHLKVKKAAS